MVIQGLLAGADTIPDGTFYEIVIERLWYQTKTLPRFFILTKIWKA